MHRSRPSLLGSRPAYQTQLGGLAEERESDLEIAELSASYSSLPESPPDSLPSVVVVVSFTLSPAASFTGLPVAVVFVSVVLVLFSL
jgi:hypothetical protein